MFARLCCQLAAIATIMSACSGFEPPVRRIFVEAGLTGQLTFLRTLRGLCLGLFCS
jgi:hypothetical protein